MRLPLLSEIVVAFSSASGLFKSTFCNSAISSAKLLAASVLHSFELLSVPSPLFDWSLWIDVFTQQGYCRAKWYNHCYATENDVASNNCCVIVLPLDGHLNSIVWSPSKTQYFTYFKKLNFTFAIGYPYAIVSKQRVAIVMLQVYAKTNFAFSNTSGRV